MPWVPSGKTFVKRKSEWVKIINQLKLGTKIAPKKTLGKELKSLSQLPEKRNSEVASPSFKTLLGIGIDIEIVLKNITEFLDECSITIGREFPAYPTNHKALAQVAFIEASPRNIATKYNETGEWIKILPILNVATGLVSVIPMRSLLTMESVKTVGLAKTTRII